MSIEAAEPELATPELSADERVIHLARGAYASMQVLSARIEEADHAAGAARNFLDGDGDDYVETMLGHGDVSELGNRAVRISHMRETYDSVDAWVNAEGDALLLKKQYEQVGKRALSELEETLRGNTITARSLTDAGFPSLMGEPGRDTEVTGELVSIHPSQGAIKLKPADSKRGWYIRLFERVEASTELKPDDLVQRTALTVQTMVQ
jgi:hypothetical protein